MPIFEYEGKKYNVRDEHMDQFINEFPDATSVMERDGKKYRVKSSDYKTFLSEKPQESVKSDVDASAPQQKKKAVFAAQTAQMLEGGKEQARQVARNSDWNFRDSEGAAQPQKTEVWRAPLQPAKDATEELRFPYAPYSVPQDDPESASKQTGRAQVKSMQDATRLQVTDLTAFIDKEMDRRGRELDAEARETEQKYWWTQMPTGPGAGMTRNTISRNGRDTDSEYRNLSAARNALLDAQRMIDEADAAQRDNRYHEWALTRFGKGAARGFGDKLFDARTWDMGLRDASDALALNEALTAFDNGEALTPSQQAMLDAKAVELATVAYFGSSISRGYTAGAIAANSIPFMLEFALNPLSTTGKTAVSKLSRYALKRFGGKALKQNAKKYAAARMAARVAGDIAGAAAMTSTTGSVRTVADAANRMNGQIYFDTDENLNAVFDGHAEGDTLGAAIAKAFASTTIENYSEMVGAYFAPVLGAVGKQVRSGMGKIGLGKVMQFVDDVSMSDVGRLISDFERNAQWNGLFGEYAEEVAGGIMNALVVGDQTLDTDEDTGVFNLNNNIDTFLGVSLMGGFFSSVKTVGYRTPKYRARRSMKRADHRAAAVFDDPEKWNDLRSAMESDEGMEQALVQVVTDPDLTEKQKAAVLEYAKAKMFHDGMLMGESKRRTDENSDPEQIDSELSFDNGYSLETPQEMNDARNMLDYRREEVARYFGLTDSQETDQFVGDDPLARIRQMRELGDEEGAQHLMDYVNARATYDGMMQRIQDDIDGRVDASQALIDSHVNSEDGMVHPATLNVDDRKVYIVSGTVSMTDDGTMIDRDASDESVVIRDAETGKLEFAAPSAFSHVGMPEDPAREMQALQVQIEEEQAQQAADKIDGVVPFHPGYGYILTDDQGIEHTAYMIADNGDGSVQVTIDDGQTPVNMAKEQIQQMVDATNMSRLQQHLQQQASERAELAMEEQPDIPSSVLDRIPKDEQGEPLYEQVDSDTAWDAIVEKTEGDEAMAQNVAESMLADKKSELKKIEKTKPKGGISVAEKIAAERERKAAIEQAKQQVEIWERISTTASRRKAEEEAQRRRQAEEAAALKKVEDEKLRAEREEEERIRREALNGVPDIVDDTPQDARARGYRRVNGYKVDRQEPVPALRGRTVEVKFSNNIIPGGRVAVIEVDQLQPSHLRGIRNPMHFIDEAQPKERNDAASVLSADEIARNIRPEEITSSVTAYTGAPTVNVRGEVIQGNNRSSALRQMWNSHPEQAEQYKQYIKEHADEFGLKAEEIDAMERPVLVNMLDVEDADAITLGQFVAQDIESGGIERIKPKNAVRRMGAEMRSFANLLLRSVDDETSFAGLVDANGAETLRWMHQRGYITPTQYKSAFDSKGAITAEAKNDLKGIMYQSIFKSGNTRLEEMFNTMPSKAQRAILATAFRDYESPNTERMLDEIQNSIRAYNAMSQDAAFAAAGNWKEARMAVEGWKKQYVMDDVSGESFLPAEKFSNFALHLATMYKGESQGIIQNTFNCLYDLIQGTQEENLFEQPDNTPRTLVQAIKEVLNIDYNGQPRSNVLAGDSTASQRGRQGGTGTLAPGRRVQNGGGTTDRTGSLEAESGTGGASLHQPESGRAGFEQNPDGGRSGDGGGMVENAAGAMAQLGNRGDIRVFEEGLAASRWEHSEYSERDRREAESERLVSIARQHNLYVPIETTRRWTGKVSKHTGESAVYIDRAKDLVLKVKNPYAKAALKSGVQPEDAAFEHLVHNLLFPETAYTFVGISEEMGDVRIILSQKFIKDYQQPSKEQIAEALAAKGLFPEDNYSFGNEFVSVTDVEGDNVLLGEDGTVYFIDPIIRFKKPLREVVVALGGVEKQAPTIGEQVRAAETEVDTHPTDKQKEAGNYKKGHVQVGTFNVTIENPKGSIRSGIDANGNRWETAMQNTYGYIRGTKGVDGDHIDVFLADDIDGWDGRRVFVIDQYNEDGTFDEHKVMLGFNDEADAQRAYLSNYEAGWADSRKIVCTSVNMEDFEKWIDSSHRKTKPFSEYKGIQKEPVATEHPQQQKDAGQQPADGYTVERRFHKKNGTYIHAVKFTEQMPRERFMELKKRVKDFGGYYSSFGKGGFIFDNEADARKFADAVLDPTGELLEDAAPVSLADTREASNLAPIQPKQIDIIGLMDEIQERGEAKLSDHVIEPPEQKNATLEHTGTNPSGNKLVTDERYEELKRRMRAKLEQLNMGIDPEMLAIGTEMAVYHIEKGARKFAEYAKAMIADLGDAVRPYLKSFYNGARDLPEVVDSGMAGDMTAYDEVRTFDVANFDKEAVDSMATAEAIVAEQKIGRQAAEAKQEIIAVRNTERRKRDEQTTADTEVVAGEAETFASQAQSDIETATDERQINETVAGIDTQVEKVNKQLALLGYYEAEFDDKDFNEAYGYMRNAEKKAVKDANSLAKRLIRDLGIDPDTIVDRRGKKRRSYADANIAPAGGEVSIRLPLVQNRELYICISLDPDYRGGAEKRNNLFVEHSFFRIEDPTGSGYTGRYIGRNNWVNPDETYADLLDAIRAEIILVAPEYDLPSRSNSIAEETPKATRKSRKKDVSSSTGDVSVADLFSGLDDNGVTKSSDNDAPVDTETKKDSGNGLQRDDAGSSEGMRADGGRHEERLSGGARESGESQSEEGREPDTGGARAGTEVDRAVRPRHAGAVAAPKNTRNNHSERGASHAPTSADARIAANFKAIELAKQLVENGEEATPEQMQVLRRYSGWGGLGKVFNESANYTQNGVQHWNEPTPENKRLRELIGEQAYQQAAMSGNSAYYTPTYIIDTLWDIARQMGFEGGNILEGSAGIGSILQQMPADISERSDIHAIEIDETSGTILSLLYPDAKVDIQGFEKTRIPNGSVDLAITNVPFVTGLNVEDTTGDKDLSRKFRNIHDFCIAKNVRKLREGGIGIFITSNGTLDNSRKLREWVVGAGGADFVGAFRMNNQTFGGTSVTSDIIVIRKRVNGRKSPYAIDVSTVTGERTVQYETSETRKIKGQDVPVVKQLAMDYNRYFIEHPENMAGVMRFGFEEGDTFRPTSKGLFPTRDKNQEQMLTDFVNSFSGKQWTEDADQPVTGPADSRFVEDKSSDGRKIGEMYVNDGKLVIANIGGYYPLEVNGNKVKGHTKVECFNAYAAIKKALADLLDYQINNEGDGGLRPLLERLNQAYDDFVATYGHFNKNTAIAFLRNDVDYPNVFALEKYDETTDVSGREERHFGKTDVFSKRVVEKEKEPTPTNVKDGIIASVFKFGRIDIPYIAGQLGEPTEEIRRDIIDNGYGFEDPLTKQLELSYQYLSGNVREKLRQAQENNENGLYDGNIKALQEVLPMDIPAHLIDFTLGSSWIDPKLYEEYVQDRTDIPVRFTSAGGTWVMTTPDYGLAKEKNRSMGIVSQMLHKTIMGHTLIEAAIQNRTITVSETKRRWDGTTETVTDKEATQACAAKIDDIRQDFRDWARQKMQEDAEMSAQIERVYNDTFNNYVPMSIPDEFVPEYFGGASHVFKMRPHQGRAIVRGTMQSLMLAHEVGTGKTFTLISTAMEMRRLGTARKPMIVVQNATVGQFVESAKELYPNAKILTLEEADRSETGRKNFYAKIRYNDWDMIVVPQSTFEFIPDSEERQMAFVQDRIDEKMLVLEQMKGADPRGNNAITRQAKREIEQLREQLAGITEEASRKRTAKDLKKEAIDRQNAEVRAREMLDRRTDDVENFDDMGIDALLVDEAHEYKHLGFATAMQRGVKGVDPSYSKKSQGVYLKTQAVLEKNNGRNVIFATGTPISNTAAEIWTFMRYLMPSDTMKEYGIYYFDDFVRNFGNIQQMLEFTTSGKFKENNRFAGYVNLPELVRIWSGVCDTVLTREAEDVSNKIPELEGGRAQDIYLPQTKALRSIMKYVKAQLEEYEKMSGKEKKENSHIPLTMYGIAKAAAVDARLVQHDAEDDPNSKTNEAVRQTLRSLKETESYKGTVALFADNYQNKQSGFNLYDDIRDKLIAAGVPAGQIVVMRSGMAVKKKLEIFDKVNKGEIRVILGSTFTLGTGVNIQERLHTLIHLDAPNRPMDYTQRNGRILRQGNRHKSMGIPVRILRFGVEDSLDVTAYQRLKTKGAIADSIMNGKELMMNSMSNRVLEEEEDVFGDTVAQLSGSEYAMLKNNAEKNVRKYESRKKQWEADQTYIHNAKPKFKALIAQAEKTAKEQRGYLDKVKKAFPNGTFSEIKAGSHTFPSVDAMSDYIKDHNKSITDAAKQAKEGKDASGETRSLSISLGGFTFVVQTRITSETSRVGGQLFTETHRSMVYSCPELGLSDVPVHQSLLRNAIDDIVENVITGKDFAERADAAERSAAHNRSELEQIEKREGVPFEFARELEDAKKKYLEYSDAMRKEMAEKEAKYAQMDAGIEAADDISVSEEDSELYREADDVQNETNEKFNNELQQQINGTLPKGHVYELGNPSEVLLSAGLPNLPIEMAASQLAYKSNSGKHDFDLSEVMDLPNAISNPIAVFEYGDKKKAQNILTILEHNGDHFLVGMFIRPTVKGRVLEINSIRNVFPKNGLSIIRWIAGGKLTYADKKELLNFLDQQRTNYADVAFVLPDEQVKQEKAEVQDSVVKSKSNQQYNSADVRKLFNLAANIIRSFENPSIDRVGKIDEDEISNQKTTISERGEMVNRINDLAKELNLDNVEVITSVSGLDGKKSRAKGFYTKSTGKITIVLPNNRNVADVEMTLLHEAVAHYGLRRMFGKQFDTFLDNVFNNADKDVRGRIVELSKRNGWNFRTATEEYLASLAETTNFENARNSGWWKRIKEFFFDMLRSMGFSNINGVTLTDNELRYVLWRSYENLKENKYDNLFSEAADVAKQYELGVGENSHIEDNGSTTSDQLFRDGSPEGHERALARQRYEERVRSRMYQTQEALQDSTLGLEVAMDAILRAEGIEGHIEDVAGYENAYLGENRLSSVNKAEADAFARLVFKPLLDEVAKLAPSDKDRIELIDYMMAKHGLVRNRDMAERDAQKAYEDTQKDHPHSKKTVQDFISEFRRRDYAGLTALTSEKDVATAEAIAQQMVDDFEETHDTKELWRRTKSVTDMILSKQYECGMISKATYDKIRGMYEFYIPLRGFDEKTSGEEYAYLTNRDSAFNAPIRKAKGRSSKADDPFANLQSMAENAIMQGNRNKLVKQRFLNFVLNHPSDLVSVSDLWIMYDDAAATWVPVFPDNIEIEDTADEVEQKLHDFETRMKQLAEEAPDRYKRGKDAIDIPYRIVDQRDLRQHQVVVRRGGRSYVLTINGNPRAAQAINGLTNPDNDISGAIGVILKLAERVNRELSAFYTTRNPDFIISNFLRDMLYANSMVWIKERPNYALRFHRNHAMVNPAMMKILFAKHRKGTLDMGDKIESMFYQFMMNGGETGYTNIRDIEQHKNDIRRELKKANGKLPIRKAWDLLGERFDEFNRAIENSARFAAFLTSREMGRSIDRAIYDAKEISVNFNKKGSGSKFINAHGQTNAGKAASLLSGLGRVGFIFWNAAIQGTTNFGRQAKRHPAKSIAGVAAMFLLGAVIAGIGHGDDDEEKNSYWNMPEYVRRSNILFRAGDQWISIPLPVEYRAIYGLGELMSSTLSGKEHYSDTELAEAIMGQVSQILPIDFMEGGGGVHAFVPSAAKPFAEVLANKSWTGLPIYKDTPFNKDMPEWTKAYKSANSHLVDLAAVLNEVSGGDRYTKGAIDINPSKVEYLLNGYFGGVSSTIDKLVKTTETLLGAREYDPRSFLILNRILKNGDERTEYRAINNEYFRAKEEHDRLQQRLRNYENDTDKGIFDYAEKIDFLYNSPEYTRYEIFESYRPEINHLYNELKDITDPEEYRQVEQELNEVKRALVEELKEAI